MSAFAWKLVLVNWAFDNNFVEPNHFKNMYVSHLNMIVSINGDLAHIYHLANICWMND